MYAEERDHPPRAVGDPKAVDLGDSSREMQSFKKASSNGPARLELKKLKADLTRSAMSNSNTTQKELQEFF